MKFVVLTDQILSNTLYVFEINTHKQLMAACRKLKCLSHSQRTTLAAIASFAKNNTLTCFPLRSTIAKAAGNSVSTVKNHLKVFRELGILTTQRNRKFDYQTHRYSNTSSTYRFNVGIIRDLMRFGMSVIKDKFQHFISKSTLSTCSPLTTRDKTNKVIDLDLVNDNEKAKDRLSTLVMFENLQSAWENRGRRYLDRKSGGLFIHSSHVTNPNKLIGYVKNSIAHQFVRNILGGNTETVKETVKIDYQHFTYPTDSHQYCVKGLFFMNKESLLAIIERNKSW